MKWFSGSAPTKPPIWCHDQVAMDPCGIKQSEFNAMQARDWMWMYRPTITLVLLLYVLFCVDLGPRVMRNRKALSCEWLQLSWNAAIAVYSWISASYLVPEYINSVAQDGFFGSLCTVRSYYTGESGLHVWMFHASKLIELGDTMWLVVRKRSVKFIHWYHHTTVLYNAWFSYMDAGAPFRIAIVMNVCVHSVMYSYFVVQQLCQKRLPRVIAAMVTAMQLVQFTIGTASLLNVTYRVTVLDEQCDCDKSTMWRHVVITGSYLLLFSHFFYKSYLKPKAHVKTE